MNSLIARLSTLGPFEPSPHLAVAVSGGADSMALVLLAQEWATAHGGRITALTVDHRLRAESTNEAAQVAQWMHSHHIEHHILTPAHHPAGNNLSAAARQWRYDAMAAWCNAQHVLHLLVAHHADDQAETSYLMQQRGTNTDGTSGMAWVRNQASVRVLRPLLSTPRHTLRNYLAERNQPWVEDPSNRDENHARVKARSMLQADPTLLKQLLHDASNAANSRAQEDEAFAKACYQSVLWQAENHTASIDHQAFMALPTPLATRLLADILRTLRGTHTRPRQHETMRLYQALTEGKKHHTLYGQKITLDGGYIRFTPEATTPRPEASANIALASARFWA